MAAVSGKVEMTEEEVTQSVRRASRRAVLSALLLSAVLWVLAFTLGRFGAMGVWRSLGLWSMFVWSLVVAVYAGLTYWRARKYVRRVAPNLELVDRLTGLPNRQALMAELDRRDLRSLEAGTRCRLIDVDLTNLNRVNEEFGQMVGDAVLQDIAGLLKNAVAEPNLLGRLAGDEFLVIMPKATTEEAESLAGAIRQAIGQYRLDVGGKQAVSSVKANVSVGTYLPEQASLHETVILAKGTGGLSALAEAEGAAPEGYQHVPRVTLGAFAAHRWQRMSEAEQNKFTLWQRELDQPTTDGMAEDILKVLDEKAEERWLDFVTAVPSHGAAGSGRAYPARRLAEAVAGKLGVPYREVMRAESSGPDTRAVEPVVDATITKGSGVLLVSEVITSGTLERRCVRKLSAAGAHVQMIAWAAH